MHLVPNMKRLVMIRVVMISYMLQWVMHGMHETFNMQVRQDTFDSARRQRGSSQAWDLRGFV